MKTLTSMNPLHKMAKLLLAALSLLAVAAFGSPSAHAQDTTTTTTTVHHHHHHRHHHHHTTTDTPAGSRNDSGTGTRS